MKRFGQSEMYALIREVELLRNPEFEVSEVKDLHANGSSIWATLAEGEDVQIAEDGKPTEAFFALKEQIASFFSASGASQGASLAVLEGDTAPWSRSLVYGEVAGLLDATSPECSFSEVLWEGFIESLPPGFAVETSGRGFVLREQN